MTHMTAVMGIFPFACYWTFGGKKRWRAPGVSWCLMSSCLTLWGGCDHSHLTLVAPTLDFWLIMFLFLFKIIHLGSMTITLVQQQRQRRWGWSSQRVWMKMHSQDWREGEVMLEMKDAGQRENFCMWRCLRPTIIPLLLAYSRRANLGFYAHSCSDSCIFVTGFCT